MQNIVLTDAWLAPYYLTQRQLLEVKNAVRLKAISGEYQWPYAIDRRMLYKTIIILL